MSYLTVKSWVALKYVEHYNKNISVNTLVYFIFILSTVTVVSYLLMLCNCVHRLSRNYNYNLVWSREDRLICLMKMIHYRYQLRCWI